MANTSFLSFQNISFSYPTSDTILFDDFSLRFTSGWTCIAGSNGCGKSTLLRIAAGLQTPDAGTVKSSGIVVYAEQNTDTIPNDLYSLFWCADSDVRRIFSFLKITPEQLERWDTLSGGEKKRIQVACALASSPAILLLDEPTNHLDEFSTNLIKASLKNFDGVGLVVTHDRDFSDTLCSSTLYLSRITGAGMNGCVTAKQYSGGLSRALELRDADKKESLTRWNAATAEAERNRQQSREWEQEAAHSSKRLSRNNGTNTRDSDLRNRANRATVSGKDRVPGDLKRAFDTRLAQSTARLNSLEKPLCRKEGISVTAANSGRRVLCFLPSNTVTAGDYTLAVPEVSILRGDRIALTGCNGTGKTLFMRSLCECIQSMASSTVSVTSELFTLPPLFRPVPGVFYLPQEITPDNERFLIDSFLSADDASRAVILSTLYRMGSEPSALLSASAKATEHSVSPGELRKLLIAAAISQPIDLLILDEPTNHMDITSRVALESALTSAGCALLVVSHDRSFLTAVTTTEYHIVKNGESGTMSIV